jgi:hypothetical protein
LKGKPHDFSGVERAFDERFIFQNVRVNFDPATSAFAYFTGFINFVVENTQK